MKALYSCTVALWAATVSLSAQVFEVMPDDTDYITGKMVAGHIQYSLRDDLLGGTWTLYYDKEKSRKIEQCTYKNEMRHGEHIRWYLNRQMKSRVLYEEGRKTGVETTWYENGQKKSESSAHSVSDTVCDRKEWYKTGELMYSERRESNRKLGTVFYPDGMVKCERVEAYTKDASVLIPQYVMQEEKCYCRSGTVMFDFAAGKGKVPYKEYHCNGNLKTEGTALHSPDYRIGAWTFYRMDGTKEMAGTYLDGDTKFRANIRDGSWYYWNGDEKLFRIEVYKDGVLVETKTMEN